MRTLLLAAAACGALACTEASAQTFTFTTLDNPGDPTFNQLLGINDAGVIVGYFGSGAVGHPNIGYQIAPPYTSYTPVMQPGSVQTQVTGINNSGVMTNFWAPTNTGMDANFGSVILPTGPNFSYISATNPLEASFPQGDQALGINNSNVAAGFYLDANGLSHGYTYNVGTAAYTPIALGGNPSLAVTGINDNNEVCGFYTSTKTGNMVGFVRNATGGVVTHFTVPKSKTTQLLGINNEGIAVGWYEGAGHVPIGLYYQPSTGAWTKVEDPNGAQGTVVNGINNKGQLVGFYIDAAGNFHGMLVTVSQ
jgi:hypothetical protein